MTFTLDIVTPQRKAFEEAVNAISVPTTLGYIGVLAHHVPLFTLLTEGEIKITQGNKEFFLAIGGGYMEVTENHVSILVSRAVHADELNESEIKRAENAARELIAKRVKGEELASARAILRRTLVEMNVLRHRHHRSGFSH